MLIQNESIRSAFFAFVDIRGFTQWSTKNQLEVKRILEMIYQTGIDCFGERKSQLFSRRIVKYLGDGFFAVNEYKDDDEKSYLASMNEIILDSLSFIQNFKKKLSLSNLHNKAELGVGIGLSFGPVLRFNLPGQPTDYSGKVVNIASRLCDAAADKEIVMEEELEKYYENKKMELNRNYFGEIHEKELKKMGKIRVFCLTPKSENRQMMESLTYATAKSVVNMVKDIEKSSKK